MSSSKARSSANPPWTEPAGTGDGTPPTESERSLGAVSSAVVKVLAYAVDIGLPNTSFAPAPTVATTAARSGRRSTLVAPTGSCVSGTTRSSVDSTFHAKTYPFLGGPPAYASENAASALARSMGSEKRITTSVFVPTSEAFHGWNSTTEGAWRSTGTGSDIAGSPVSPTRFTARTSAERLVAHCGTVKA